jgi:hypothetical protein
MSNNRSPVTLAISQLISSIGLQMSGVLGICNF